MSNIVSDLVYGIDINYSLLDEEDGEEYISEETIDSFRKFKKQYGLHYFTSGDDEYTRDLIVGVALWEIEDKTYKMTNLEKIQKAKEIFEEKTRNGVLEELQKRLGWEESRTPDIHMNIDEC